MLQGRPIHVIQGEFKVSNDPDVVFATLLGSCVAACIRDPSLGAGGINHFLLPGDKEHSKSAYAERYGVHLMELLINGLMQMGAKRNRLEAKLFGGARMVNNLSDIGMQNAEFAERFLRHEGIPIVSQDLGGTRGRRIQFWPVSGRARQSYISPSQVMEREKVVSRTPAPVVNEIELF